MLDIKNSQPARKRTSQAESLLHLLAQLASPMQGLLLAEPTGQILVANAQMRSLLPIQADGPAKSNLFEISGISDEEAASLIEQLQAQQKAGFVLSPSPGANGLGRISLSCQLVAYQQEQFMYVEAAAQNTLQAQEPAESDGYRAAFENSTEPLFILDGKGCFIDVNKTALSLIDRHKEEMLGNSISSFFGLSLFERIALKRQLDKTLEGEPHKFEWWLHEKTQELLPVEISLTKGSFKGKHVIFGSAKNLVEAVGKEQSVWYRNHQLEFVNNLITNLSAANSKHEILKNTLDELLAKSDVSAGCVYAYSPAEEQGVLAYSAGALLNKEIPATVELPLALTERLLTSERRRALAELSTILQQHLDTQLTVVPITTDKAPVAFLVVWTSEEKSMTASFTSLLDFISSAIGNYMSRHELLQQLSNSEDKYKMLFESSYDAILLFKDGKVLDCNEKALQFFRCKREDILGHAPIDFSPEYQPDGSNSKEKTASYMQQVLSTGNPMTFEWHNIRKDGTKFDSEISINRILIDGEYHVQAFKRDITQRKLAQLARRREEVMTESMMQFRDFLGKVNLIYYSTDVQGNITFANDYFLEYTEYSKEELVGRNFFEVLVREQDQEHRRQEIEKAVELRKLNTYYERDIVTKTGQLKTYRWNSMFEYSPDGDLIGITNVGKDMTDKRIAMEALKDNKLRLQDLFDNAHDLIQNLTLDNKFIFVNKAWKDRLGYTDEDVETLTLHDVVHPYYKAKLIYQLRNLYKGDNVNKVETVFLTKAGKAVHLIGSLTCNWQDGKPVASRAILHDITERIKAERLQKVYYSIANLAISSKDHYALYNAIHRELSKIIETRNIYIALCDRERKHLQFVYLVDQFHDKSSDAQLRSPFSNGLSEYIIRSGKPLYMQKQELLELCAKQNLAIKGEVPEVILCSPLSIGDRIIGVIALQDYQNADAYVHTDLEILHFISNQVALAIERKQNEEQINSQNAKLNAIFESGTHHMWTVNRNLELTSFNQNFARDFSGRSGHELTLYTKLDSNQLISFHENTFAFWKEKYSSVFEVGPQFFEMYMQASNSWREVHLNPIYMEDGTFDEVSAIALDISDKKQSQLGLAESEKKFRRIFESFQDVYYRITIDGILELVSPSIKALLGYTEEEVLGRKTTGFYANPEDKYILKELVLEKETIRDIEVDLVCKDGTKKTILMDSRLVYDAEGNPVATEGVIRDVSELKKTQIALLKAKEEAENLLKVKTQFLANMSHELRTPMNGIIGMIDLLTQINTDVEQQEYIDTLRKSSDALLAILNDILDLSKMQAGKLLISESGIDIYDTLGKIHSLFANRAQQKDLNFTYHITPETPRYILTDETRFLQILSNLTSNAIKFTNAGEVSISVSSTPLKDEEFMLHVRVKDSGIGISKEGQQVLFTDFTQLDNSSTKTFGGTGLGLAISKQITQLLGGAIGVDSDGVNGSTFWFNIKTSKANQKQVETHLQLLKQQKVEVEVLDNSPYVLLVDDNQINQKVAEKLLERLGCVVDIASNGFEAIEFASKNSYGIIFMDIQMPEMDGVTATKLLKEQLGENCPPVVAMTAYSMKDDAERFLSEGMDDYVSKPVKSNALHSVITKWQKSIAASLENGTAPVAVAAEAPDEEEHLIIDTQVAEQLKSIGGEEFTMQLYIEFEQEAAELLEGAKKDLESKHYKSILSTLHQLKGTSFTLGINTFAELAKQLEHDIKEDKFEQVEENFSKLLEQYKFYKNAYKEIIT